MHEEQYGLLSESYQMLILSPFVWGLLFEVLNAGVGLLLCIIYPLISMRLHVATMDNS